MNMISIYFLFLWDMSHIMTSFRSTKRKKYHHSSSYIGTYLLNNSSIWAISFQCNGNFSFWQHTPPNRVKLIKCHAAQCVTVCHIILHCNMCHVLCHLPIKFFLLFLQETKLTSTNSTFMMWSINQQAQPQKRWFVTSSDLPAWFHYRSVLPV